MARKKRQTIFIFYCSIIWNWKQLQYYLHELIELFIPWLKTQQLKCSSDTGLNILPYFIKEQKKTQSQILFPVPALSLKSDDSTDWEIPRNNPMRYCTY